MSSGQMLPIHKPPGHRDLDKPARRRPPPPLLKAKRGRTCCCWCCIVTALLILLFFSTGAFFYIWYQPRLPEIGLDSIQVTKFDVGSTPNGPILDLESTIRVKIKNPNPKLGIKYERTSISLKSDNDNGGVNLGKSEVPEFDQGAKNITTIELKAKAKERVKNKEAQELKEGYESKNLLVNMELESRVGVKASGWGTKSVAINVACGGIRLTKAPDSNGSPKCRVKLMNRFHVN